jgi:hypothetical protein
MLIEHEGLLLPDKSGAECELICYKSSKNKSKVVF